MPAEDEPRQTHVLRPHHIAILSVFILAFGDIPSPKFHLHIWRVLAREIAETQPPKSFEQLIEAVVSGPYDYPDEAANMERGLRNVPKHLSTHDGLSQFFANVVAFVPDRETDSAAASSSNTYSFERRSYFGLFIRRCYLSFFKLSWRGTIKLLEDYKEWVEGKDAGYNMRTTDRDGGLLIMPALSDELQFAQIDSYEKYEKAIKVGDTQSAIENLRRFFDQRFSENDESGLTQHALLNLARLHYSQGESGAAATALEEALKVARTANDIVTVQHCNSLMKRLQPVMDAVYSGGKSSAIKPQTPALEVLWEAKTMMEGGEPLRACFRKLYQSIGCADAAYSDIEESKWARHAVQATLWSYAGVESLAQTHENIIITFTEPGDDESRLSAIHAKARRLLRQGNVGGALVLLLDPDTWRGLNLRQYGLWAHEVWKALFTTTRRRGQEIILREFLFPRKPAQPSSMQTHSRHSDFPKKHGPMMSTHLARCAIETRQFTGALNPVLDALWTSEYRGMWMYHRLAVVQLAEICIELGMAGKGRRSIEGCLPQLLNGDDLEIRAYACYTLARCIMAESWSKDDPRVPPSPKVQALALEEAVPFLQAADSDYAKIQMYQKRLEVLYTLSVVYHNLAKCFKASADTSGAADRNQSLKVARQYKQDSERSAEAFQKVDEERKEAAAMLMDAELREVLVTVVEVAAVINR